MPTLRHHQVARHTLEVISRTGPQTAEAIRTGWTVQHGPPPEPDAVFFNDVVRMLIEPGGYVIRKDDELLAITADGEMVASGGEFIFGR